jgi:hypothetical protein
MQRVLLIGLIISIGLMSHTFAQTTTDVPQTVSSLLKAFGPVSYTTSVQIQTQCKDFDPSTGAWIWSPCLETETVTTHQILTASNFVIVSRTDPEFGAPIYTDFPTNLTANFATIRNCNQPPPPPSSQTPPSTQVNLSVTVTRTTSVTISQSFTKGGSDNIGINLGEKDVGGITGNISVTESNTSGTATTTADAQGVTQAEINSYPEPWMSSELVGISAYRIGISIPFTLTAAIDADISPNDRGFKKLSDVITAAQRTFLISGQIVTDTASKAQVTNYPVQPLSASDCPLPGVAVKKIEGREVNPIRR